MRRPLRQLAAAAAALLALSLNGAPGARAGPPTMAELLAASSPQDWRQPDAENTLYLDLAAGRVVIELAARVAPRHVANIKALARAHYFDGLAIVRVQDNYVVQWADPDHHRPIPAGIGMVAPELTAAAGADQRFEPLAERDAYAPQTGFIDGFPAGRDPRTHTAWLTHCYGMVGVGRDDPPQSDGTEMYVVIGNAPRHLDRNVALVGRVLVGMELLSSLPRGSGDMGFYTATQANVPIVSAHVAADVLPTDRVPLEILRTGSATFRAVLDQRRHRPESWFQFHPGHIDVCNVPLPVRAARAGGP